MTTELLKELIRIPFNTNAHFSGRSILEFIFFTTTEENTIKIEVKDPLTFRTYLPVLEDAIDIFTNSNQLLYNADFGDDNDTYASFEVSAGLGDCCEVQMYVPDYPWLGTSQFAIQGTLINLPTINEMIVTTLFTIFSEPNVTKDLLYFTVFIHQSYDMTVVAEFIDNYYKSLIMLLPQANTINVYDSYYQIVNSIDHNNLTGSVDKYVYDSVCNDFLRFCNILSNMFLR